RGLNNPEKLAPETRAAVEGAIKTLGYRVNALARSIRTRTTGAVALLVHDIRNPVFAAVAQAAQGRLNRSGYLVVVAGSDPAVASDAQIIHALTERRIDGLIAFLRREDDAAVVAALDGFGGPIVLVDREMSIATD